MILGLSCDRSQDVSQGCIHLKVWLRVIAHSHCWLLARGLSSLPHGPLHQAPWVSQCVGFLQREWSRRESKVEAEMSIYDLDSKFTLHHSIVSYCLHKSTLFDVRDGYTRLGPPGSETHREPFWQLTTTRSYPQRFNSVCLGRTRVEGLRFYLFVLPFPFILLA